LAGGSLHHTGAHGYCLLSQRLGAHARITWHSGSIHLSAATDCFWTCPASAWRKLELSYASGVGVYLCWSWRGYQTWPQSCRQGSGEASRRNRTLVDSLVNDNKLAAKSCFFYAACVTQTSSKHLSISSASKVSCSINPATRRIIDSRFSATTSQHLCSCELTIALVASSIRSSSA